MKKFSKKLLCLFLSFLSGTGLSQTPPSFVIGNLSSSYSITCKTPSVNLIALSAVAGPLTYSWTNGVNAYTGTNVLISNAGTYTVTAYASPTLSSSQTFTIGTNLNVPGSTVVPIIQNIMCSFSPMTLSASISSTVNTAHQWLSPYGGTVFVPTGSLSTYGVSSVGIYTHVAINLISGCSVSKTFTVMSSDLYPSFNLSSNPSNYTLGCSQATSSLTLSILNGQGSGGAVSYTLLPPGASTVLPGSLSAATIYTISTIGTWTAVIKDNTNMCVTRSAFSVTQNTTQPSIYLAASSQSVCPGGTVAIVADGANTYTFSGGVSAGVPFTVNSVTTVSVTGTSTSNGCSTSSPVVISINTYSIPVVAASITPSLICGGNTVMATSSGADTYTWTGGVTNGQSFSVSSTSSYTVSGTSTLTGCTSTNIATVIVNPLPTLSITSSQTSVCIGKTVALTATGADTYTWSGGITNGQPFIPTNTSTYVVSGTNTLSGCSNTLGTTHTVYVNPLPMVIASSSSQSVCLGNTVSLSGSGANTYTWAGGILNNGAFSPVATASYVVIGRDSNGCEDADSIIVTVLPLPTLSVTSSEPVFCAGMTTTLTASGAISYSWAGGASGTDFIVNPIFPTVYSVNGSDANNCVGTANYSLNINNATSFNYTVNGTQVTLAIVGTGCSSFTWDFGNGITNSINYNPVITYTTDGTYGICLKCNDLPNVCVRCMNIKVPSYSSGGVGIEEQALTEQLLIYPNPNAGEFTIDLREASSTGTLLIYTPLGKVIRQLEIKNQKTSVDLSGFSKGIYYVEIYSNSRRISNKLIIQ